MQKIQRGNTLDRAAGREETTVRPLSGTMAVMGKPTQERVQSSSYGATDPCFSTYNHFPTQQAIFPAEDAFSAPAKPDDHGDR